MGRLETYLLGCRISCAPFAADNVRRRSIRMYPSLAMDSRLLLFVVGLLGVALALASALGVD